MSIILEASYSKKLGLPNFSSHQFSVSVRAEVTSLRRVETETGRLYRILQESVDKQVEQVGFLPDATKYGMLVDATPPKNGAPAPQRSNGHKPVNGASVAATPATSTTDAWDCSERQRALIEKVAKEQKFTHEDVDGISDRLFQLPVQRLNKTQASDLIGELLAIAGPPSRHRRFSKPTAAVSVNGSR